MPNPVSYKSHDGPPHRSPEVSKAAIRPQKDIDHLLEIALDTKRDDILEQIDEKMQILYKYFMKQKNFKAKKITFDDA